MRIALYVRVSKAGQETENQLSALRQFSPPGSEIVAEYVEIESGGSAAREQLRRMIDDARKGKFDVLHFWALDRLSREGALRTLQYLDQLSGYGVKWRSLQEPYIDSLGPFGEAIIGLIATIARMERDRIRERTKAGLEEARKKGKVLGQPRKILDLEAIGRMRSQGKSFAAIGKVLGVSAATIFNRMKPWERG